MNSPILTTIIEPLVLFAFPIILTIVWVRRRPPEGGVGMRLVKYIGVYIVAVIAVSIALGTILLCIYAIRSFFV